MKNNPNGRSRQGSKIRIIRAIRCGKIHPKFEYKSIGEQTMIFDRNEQKEVIALLGAGSMGTAIVRRIGAGKKILLGEHAKFITGTDLLIDGGVIAAIRTGEYQLG